MIIIKRAVKVTCFSSVHLLSRVRLFATPRTAARQASLSITNSRSLLTLMSIKSVMPSKSGFPCGSVGKESACDAGDPGSIPGRRRERLPTPGFQPGEFHGLHSPWGLKELDMTERFSLHCNVLESSPKPLPCPQVCGKIVFYETGPRCQKGWALLS